MEQPKVAIIYHGMSGALQAMAQEAAAGAEECGATVRVRRVPERHGSASEPNGRLATPADVRWTDAVVVGSPTR
jgi:NAD(P)H dehydrogenase (quinone)